MKPKKLLAVILSAVTVFSLFGCNKKENNPDTKEETKVSSDIVGVWVVESRENIRNEISDELLEKMYPTGLEIEFTSDGKYIFGGRVIEYKIIDNATLEVKGDIVELLGYELSDDSLKIYYMGKDHAVIMKRK